MALTFESVINLTTYDGNVLPSYVGSLMIANEPKNDINQFYIHTDKPGDKNSHITSGLYESLVWTGPNASMTNMSVKRIGIKTFPQIGAMAFYSLLNEERSFILAPLFIEYDRYTRPTMVVVQDADSITFTMASPNDIEYICWRVVLRCGDTAFEYISYEDTLVVDNPYLSGEYDCYCVGYVGEGQAVSDDSEHVTLTIVGSGVDPLDSFSYYTKAEIDALLSALS